MKRRAWRIWTWLVLALGGGFVFQVIPATPVVSLTPTSGGSCRDLGINAGLISMDWCSIFDCQSGFLGGTIQPCGSSTSTADDFFLDCGAGATATTP